MDCTIISTLPFRIEESRPGLYPSRFVLGAAPRDSVSSLMVKDGYHYVPSNNDKQPLIPVTDVGEKICKSVIDDFVSSCPEVMTEPNSDGIIPKPGIFFVNGAFQQTELPGKFKLETEKAHKQTLAWFERLVKEGDVQWAKLQHPKAVMDIQKMAALYMGIDRPWSQKLTDMIQILCTMCRSKVNKEAVLCPNCKFILKPEKFKAELFAKV